MIVFVLMLGVRGPPKSYRWMCHLINFTFRLLCNALSLVHLCHLVTILKNLFCNICNIPLSVMSNVPSPPQADDG